MKALAAAVLLAFVPIQADTGPTATVITDGHVDLGPRFVDGKWTVQLRDDTVNPAVWRPLDQVVVQATDKARLAVPADPAFAFLGKPGQQVWVIPQVQQAGIVWPGWNTQDPEVAKRVDREVTWSLEGVRGPGTFTLFLSSDFGKPSPVFDSRKPYPQRTGVDVNTHVHGNWTFDKPGLYQLDVAMTAKLTDGSTVTDRRALNLYAGPGDPRAALATASPAPTPPASPGVTPSRAAETPADGTRPVIWLAGGAGALVLAGLLTFLIRRAKKGTR